VDGEGGVESNLQGVVTQQPRAHCMECACPEKPLGQHRRLVAHHLRRDAGDPPCHLCGGTARERHQQDAARVRSLDEQVRDTVRQRIGLPRSGACNDQQRSAHSTAAMLHRSSLLGIEPGEIVDVGSRITDGDVHRRMKHRFRFVRNA
jgi:hypothetical protein